MAGLNLSHIYKVYPNGVKAVNDFCMDIDDKEFIVFVGPSGCGKSTTLRMIAGLEEITAGQLQIDGTVVNDVEPKDRDIAMVFQNYALYPHLTVYQNMALGLKLRKFKAEEIEHRVMEAAKILDITDYLTRRPKELSGGQRQRVALGRAIVREPKVFLLDEPLSNLDAKLRTAMRAEIAKLHKKIGTTFIYVTHDQTEAMTMGTRIVVMKEGVIQQIDNPLNLYRHPCNKFVAGFIGTPQMNFFEAILVSDKDKVEICLVDTEQKLTVDSKLFVKVHSDYLHNKKVTLGIRPEHLQIVQKADQHTLQLTVSHIEELGTECLVYGDLCGQVRAIVKVASGTDLQIGQKINVSVDTQYLHLFDSQTEDSLIPQIPQSALVDCTVKGNVLSVGKFSTTLPQHLSLADGQYEVDIPTTAVLLNGSFAVEDFCQEVHNDKVLIHINLGSCTVFALASKKMQKVSMDIDFKQLTILKNDKVVVEPLADNKLVCTLSGKKQTVTNEQNKKSTQWHYSLNVAGSQLQLPQQMANHVLKALGQSAFKQKLRLEVHPDNMQIATQGLPATVLRIVEYGTQRYAVCKLQEDSEVCCKLDGQHNIGDSIQLVPSLENTKIYEQKREIRIV